MNSGAHATPVSRHPCDLEEGDFLKQCELEFTRRSGPGGQHRNKVETAVVVTHVPSGISAEGNERRSQLENRQEAIHRLRIRLAERIRTVRPPEVVPSPLWQARQESGSTRVSRQHRDFPALLAEALDWLAQSEFQPAQAAARLGCSTSYLIRLCRLSVSAFQFVNTERQRRGLRPLR